MPGAKKTVQRRLIHVLQTYPDLHSLCLWQSEGRGVGGWPEFSVSSRYQELHRKYASHFRYLAKVPARQAEAIRLAEWFIFIHHIIRKVRPTIKLVFAGWGGDRWMRWGDYWRGLDEILPNNVVFSQLDNINPYAQETVSRATAGIAKHRELWSIPWLESDSGSLGRASMWHPQDDAERITMLGKAARGLGYRGLLGIHWQTAGAELNAACLASAGWKISDTANAFRSRYASSFFSHDKTTASKVERLLEKLEQLGPGWTGTGQQVECSKFSWEPFSPVSATGKLPHGLRELWRKMEEVRRELFETPIGSLQICSVFDSLLFCFNQNRKSADNLVQLERLRVRLVSLRLKTPHARRLLATMNFVLAYEKIRRELAPNGRLHALQATLKESHGLGFRIPKLVAEYNKGLEQVEAWWAAAFAAQANRLDTVGDFGNLANLNIKAYVTWKEFRDSLVD